MIFMSAVGHTVAGGGLAELWSTVQAPSSVSHMVTGNADSRTLRAHFVTQKALATILLKTSKCTRRHTQTVFVKFITVFRKVLTVMAELLDNIKRICDNTKELWIQYFK